MGLPERVRDLVLEEARKTSEVETRRRSNRDDDCLALPALASSDLRASARVDRRGDDDDVTMRLHLEGAEPLGKELRQIARSPPRTVVQGELHAVASNLEDVSHVGS